MYYPPVDPDKLSFCQCKCGQRFVIRSIPTERDWITIDGGHSYRRKPMAAHIADYLPYVEKCQCMK